MAAPAGPRPGWSRRAQYSLFFAFLATIVGIVVGLVMLVLSLVAPSAYDSVRGAALDVTAPITEGLSDIGSTVGGLVSGASDYWDAADQNGALREQNQQLRREILKANAVQQENLQLKKTLALREQVTQAVASGRIVGSSFQSPRRYAILSVGRNDGVAIGMPVRAADGLVGRVIEAILTQVAPALGWR